MEAGDRIGAYRVLRRLGAGGMGEVYEAEGGDGAHVALKLFAADGAKADFFRRRFLVEARLLSRLSHPRLVKMYDYMTPHGLVIKLNAEKSGAVSDEEVRDNDEFWDWMTKRLLSDPQFVKRRAERWRRTADGEWDPDHRMGVRAFARLRLTHAKLYARQAKNPIAFARAIRQAIAIDPQDKETCINYAAFLKVNKLDTAREDFLGCLKKLGVDTDGWR